MNLINALGFGRVMYPAIFHIRHIQKEVRKYKAAGDLAAEMDAISRAEHTWGNYVVKKIGIDLRVTGLENIPDGPVVYVSNHQSFMDIPIYCAAIPEREFSFVAKRDLLNIPLYAAWMQDVRCVMMDRDDPRDSLRAINEGIALLKQGFSLGIFPEGTRGKNGVMGPFKKGSMRLATKPGMPVVPITLNGSYHCLEEKQKVLPAVVDFCIHPAISTEGMEKREAGELSERVEAIIRAKLEEFQAEDARR